MQPRKKFHMVFSVVMGAMMISIMTFVITWMNVGLGPQFLAAWVKAFAIAYAIGLPVIFFLAPERIADGAQWAKRLPELLAMPGPVFVELMVAPVPQQTRQGFQQEELPPNQYTRMGDEALALQTWLAQTA